MCAQAAFDLLQHGYTVEQVARRIGVTPDRLRLVIVQVYKWTPSKIRRAVRLASRTADEPHSFAELLADERADAALQQLLGDIDAGHPLNHWAKRLVMSGYHPERMTVAYRERLYKLEDMDYLSSHMSVDVRAVMQMSINDLREIDWPALLDARQKKEARVRQKANQRRRARSAAAK
jgi:hypothetical protein